MNCFAFKGFFSFIPLFYKSLRQEYQDDRHDDERNEPVACSDDVVTERFALPEDHAEHRRRHEADPDPDTELDGSDPVKDAPGDAEVVEDVCRHHAREECEERHEGHPLLPCLHLLRGEIEHAHPCSAENLRIEPYEAKDRTCDRGDENRYECDFEHIKNRADG